MAPILAALVSAGAGFVTDLIKDKGEDLAIKGIQKVTGIDLKKEPELTPEMVQFINESKIKILELDFEKLKLEYANTADARDMQKEALKQDDKFAKRYVYYLASFWSIVGVVYIFMITFADIPDENVRFADTVLGFLLGTIVATIINFFFGSSSGSKEKAEDLKSIKKEMIGR